MNAKNLTTRSLPLYLPPPVHPSPPPPLPRFHYRLRQSTINRLSLQRVTQRAKDHQENKAECHYDGERDPVGCDGVAVGNVDELGAEVAGH